MKGYLLLVFIMLVTKLVSTMRHSSKTWARLQSLKQRSTQTLVLDERGVPKGSRDERRRYRLVEEQLSGLPDLTKLFLTLGIESSCDDTGVAVVSSDGKVLSNVVMSQYKIHENFGGVVPSLAMEAHKANIDIAVERAIQEAGLSSIKDINAVAVTKGPGLEICLRIGLRKAQAIALENEKPFVTVHHLEAHCLVARLAGLVITPEGSAPIDHPVPKLSYPFLALLASGGHTSLLLCHEMGEYELLGGTLDDALGEALDKGARLLGLNTSSISGGAAMEKMAKLYEEKYMGQRNFSHIMTVPMRDRKSCDFSYAGLKNAFRQEVLKARQNYQLDTTVTNAPSKQMQPVQETVALPEDITSYLCYAFQDIAFQHVEDKIKRAFKKISVLYPTPDEDGDNSNSDSIIVDIKRQPLTAFVVVGGVASNQELRRRLLNLLSKLEQPLPLIFPPASYCTDNGVMVAWAGIEKLKRGISNAIEEQETMPKWHLGTPLT